MPQGPAAALTRASRAQMIYVGVNNMVNAHRNDFRIVRGPSWRTRGALLHVPLRHPLSSVLTHALSQAHRTFRFSALETRSGAAPDGEVGAHIEELTLLRDGCPLDAAALGARREAGPGTMTLTFPQAVQYNGWAWCVPPAEASEC